MVTIYGPDTSSIIKAVSDKLQVCPSTVPQVSKKKKQKRGHLLEMSKIAQKKCDSSDHSVKIVSWLRSVSGASRLQFLTVHNPLVASFIRQMYMKKLTEGEFDFSLIPEASKTAEEDKLDDYFYSRRKNLNSILPSDLKFSAEKKIEEFLRLTDTDEYLDTVSIDPMLAEDCDYFLQLMNQVSKNRAFGTPCKAVWDSSTKKWVWEYPPWMTPKSFNTLGGWICATYERALWKHYWISNESGSPVEEDSKIKVCFEEKQNLKEFLSQLTLEKKNQLLGNTEELQKEFQIVKQELSRAGEPKLTTWLCKSLNFQVHSSKAGLISGVYSANSYQKMRQFQTKESLELITKTLNTKSPEDFIELVSSSSLNRIFTPLDIVTRKVLEKLKAAYTEKNAQDLLEICEEEAKERTRKSKKNKRKKRNRNLSTASARSESTNSSTKGLQEEEEPSNSESLVVLEIVQSIMNKVISNIEEEKEPLNEEHFQTVENPRRRNKNQNFQSKNKRPYYKRNNRKNYKNQNKKPQKNPVKREKREGYRIEWQKLTYSQQLPLTNQAEFPPLLASPDPWRKSQRLHQEILNFGNQVMSSVTKRKPIIEAFLYKLNEVVQNLFPAAMVELYGSYGSGLAIDVSDIDVIITNTNLRSRELIQIACLQLANVLESCGWVLNVNTITTATVPVIKLEFHSLYCAGTGNEIMFADVTFDDSGEGQLGTHLGLTSLMKTRELMNSFPQVQYLALVLKHFLYKHSLNSAYKGGLSSYSLTIWIVASLNKSQNKTENLGESLLEFLSTFGHQFDPSKMGVNILNNG